MTTGGKCRMAGLAVGAGVGFAVTRTSLFEWAPVVVALGTVIGLLAGEAVTPRPARQPGVASLRARRLRDQVPLPAVIVALVLSAGVEVLALQPRRPLRPDHEMSYLGHETPVSLVGVRVTLIVAAVLALLIGWAVARVGVDEAQRRGLVRRVFSGWAVLAALLFTATGFWYADDQLDWRGGGVPAYGIGLSLVSGVGLLIFARYAGLLAVDERVPVAS